MRRLIFIPLSLGLCATASAQTPPAPPPQTPAAQPADTESSSRSLFDLAPRQFEIGGRITGIDGDPARFQRYQDYRDGLLLTRVRYASEEKTGKWLFHGLADNVGWRDQKYAATYDRPGRFTASGVWDQIPQFYSVDTMTPYSASGATLTLPDATQQSIQNNSSLGLQPYVPISPQFELRERRDIGRFDFRATPATNVDLTANFTTQRHRGELPWGASFGFSNDVEVALPYDSRTNDLTLGTEWSDTHNMLRVAYSGSWFDNLDDTLVWDSPLRLTDIAGTPGRGRMSLWPSNSAQTVNLSGLTKMPRHTQVTGFLSYGLWSNDQPLQPFTINSALAPIPLPRETAEASARVTSTNLNLVSRPLTDWRLSARVRSYNYDNRSTHTLIPQYVSYDANVSTSLLDGPERYSHNRNTIDTDATYTGVKPLALTFGYTRNDNGYDFRIFESSGENVWRIGADAVGTKWATFRAVYEHSDRTGSGLNEDLLKEIEEHPEVRHYDLSDRTRDRFNGQVDIVPNDTWTFSLSTGVGSDSYPGTVFGLQDYSVRTYSIGADFHQGGYSAGITYNYERYKGLQQSHEGDSSDAQFNDPKRDWTVDTSEQVDYVALYLTPPKFGKLESRLSYDYSFAEGNYFYTIPAGSPITAPNQLPNVHNKLQQLHLDARYPVTPRLAATFSYLYEPFRVYDFAFDPSVVNGIAQPSSLVMGYVYRPYTANSVVLGVRYVW